MKQNGVVLSDEEAQIKEKRPYNLRERKIQNAAYRDMIRAELADELYEDHECCSISEEI